jgi:hypothetical protein
MEWQSDTAILIFETGKNYIGLNAKDLSAQ